MPSVLTPAPLTLPIDPCPACRQPRPARYVLEHALCAPCTTEVSTLGATPPLREVPWHLYPTEEV